MTNYFLQVGSLALLHRTPITNFKDFRPSNNAEKTHKYYQWAARALLSEGEGQQTFV